MSHGPFLGSRNARRSGRPRRSRPRAAVTRSCRHHDGSIAPAAVPTPESPADRSRKAAVTRGARDRVGHIAPSRSCGMDGRARAAVQRRPVHLHLPVSAASMPSPCSVMKQRPHRSHAMHINCPPAGGSASAFSQTMGGGGCQGHLAHQQTRVVGRHRGHGPSSARWRQTPRRTSVLAQVLPFAAMARGRWACAERRPPAVRQAQGALGGQGASQRTTAPRYRRRRPRLRYPKPPPARRRMRRTIRMIVSM